MLNGKAKEEFEKWLIEYYLINRQDYNQFTNDSILKKHYRKTQIEQNALIIEWFDEIDIIINPYKCSDGLWDYEINNFDSNLGNGLAFKSRTEATTKAIEKAVGIFNKLHNGK
jgi:hypothetical protein